jgi:hypothetical protein
MELLRNGGYFVEKVEQVVHGTFIKRDAFGFIDLMAIKAECRGVLGVQVCASDRKADHVAKARLLEAIWTFLRAGNRIQVHSWRKRRERHLVTRKWSVKRWAVVISDLSLEDLLPEPDWTVVRAELAAAAAAKKAASLEKRRKTLEERKRVVQLAKEAAL